MTGKVTVLFFASLREAVGQAQMVVQARDTAEVLAKLANELPPDAIAALTADNVRIAVNQALTSDHNAVLSDGDVVAFMPPVTGG